MKNIFCLLLIICSGCNANMSRKVLHPPVAETDKCLDARRVLVTVIEMLQISNVTVHVSRIEKQHSSYSPNPEHDRGLTVDIRPLQDVVDRYCMNVNGPIQRTQIKNSQAVIRKSAVKRENSIESKGMTSFTYSNRKRALYGHHERKLHQRRSQIENKLVSPIQRSRCPFSSIIQDNCVASENQEFTILFSAKDGLDVEDTYVIRQINLTSTSLSLVGISDSNLLRKFLESRTWQTVTALTIQASRFINFDLVWMNEFPNLNSLSLQTFARVNNTGWKYTNYLERIEFQNVGVDTFYHAKILENMEGLHYFSLQDTNIKQLDQFFFHGAPNLEEIVIIRTHIERILTSTFSNLIHLRSLMIGEGRIADLPQQLFVNQGKMTHLSIDNNQLTRLMNGHFTGLQQLQSLHLMRNRISTVERNTFAPVNQLQTLILQGNELTNLNYSLTNGLFEGNQLDHSSPHGIQLNLKELDLRWNNQLQIQDDLFQNFTNIESILISACSLSKMPKLIHLNHLRFLAMNNHDIAEIELSTSVPFEHLEFFAISRKPGDSPAKITWGGNETSVLPKKLRRFEAENVNVLELNKIFSKVNSSNIRNIRLGWEGMNERTFDITVLCNALATDVDNLAIHRSSFTTLNLCSGKDYDNVVLTENKHLDTLYVPGFPQQVNVSGCSKLANLFVAEVPVLDISGTILPLSEAWCSTWGTDTLIARGIAGPRTTIVPLFVQRIVQRCIATSSFLDISYSPWITRPDWLDKAGRRPIALSQVPVFDVVTGQPIPFRAAPPLIQIENTPITCELQFTTLAVMIDNEVHLKRHFFVTCRCDSGYTLRNNDRCVAVTVDVTAIVVGSVMGTFVVFGAFMLLIWQIVRFRNRGYRLQNEKSISERLLEEREEEVLALKRVWEIDFHELHFHQMLASGGFGIVYKAYWENMDVAIKVLKTDVTEADDNTTQEFEKEVDFLQRTRHPCVIRFFGAGVDPRGARFLVLEYASLGSLQHILTQDLKAILETFTNNVDLRQKNSQDSMRLSDIKEENDLYIIDSRREHPTSHRSISSVWELKMSLILDVAEGMAFIHSLDHIHRDLKSGNVLVTDTLRGKISDFGSIKQCFSRTQSAHCPITAIDCDTDIPYSSEQGIATMSFMTMDCVGTPLYMAPEALARRSSTSKADVFSYGVLLWEIATQRRPDIIEQEKGSSYSGPLISTLLSLLEDGCRLSFQTNGMHFLDCERIPSWYRSLTLKCMSSDPSDRPSFNAIIPQMRAVVPH